MIKKQLYKLKKRLLQPSKTKATNAKNHEFVKIVGELFLNRSKYAAVLGNGTSINEIDLTLFKNTDLFVSNYFFKHPDYEKLNIKLYFILDPFRPQMSAEEYSEWYNTFFSGAFRNKSLSRCIIHHTVYDFLRANTNLISKYPKVIPYLPSVYSYDDFLQNDDLLDKYLPDVRHTPMLPLVLAIQQGYSQIFISGLDHDFIKKRFEGIETVAHFYKEEKSQMQHLHRPLSEEFYLSAVTFNHYEKILALAKLNDTTIINLAKKSCLDMFEKREFEEFHDAL